MKKFRLIYLALLFVALQKGNTLCAQDPHFSQYFNALSWVNPSLTGVGVDDWRVAGTYRSQWWGGNIAPFTTSAVSIEKAFVTGMEGKSKIGVGLSMLSDASNAGLLKNNYINTSIAYNLALSRDATQVLGFGFNLSFANRMLDAGKFAFQSQYGSMGFQRTAPSGDPATVLSANYFDVSAGGHYSKTASNWGLDIGAALFHANGPQQSVYAGNTYNLAQRFTGYGSVFFILKNEDQVQFSTVADAQSGHTIFTLGGTYKIRLHEEGFESLNIGLYNRFSDAFYPYAAIEGKKWVFGLSYDVVSNDLKSQYNSVQSIEFSFAVKFGKHR
jgi:type IX secretion system PorP/SprF family membrane protein